MKKDTHWTRQTHFFRKDEYECSACHYVSDKPYEICPNCGSPMKGSKYDPAWVDEMEALDAIFDD